MRIPVRCTACGFTHRADLRELPEDVLVCPLCEHEAKLPDEQEVAEFEQVESRQRLLTVLGGGAFLLGMALAAGHAGLSDAHPGEPLFGPLLLGAAGVLGLSGLVVTVLQESKACSHYF